MLLCRIQWALEPGPLAIVPLRAKNPASPRKFQQIELLAKKLCRFYLYPTVRSLLDSPIRMARIAIAYLLDNILASIRMARIVIPQKLSVLQP